MPPDSAGSEGIGFQSGVGTAEGWRRLPPGRNLRPRLRARELCLPLLEAQACGLATVARDLPALRETGGPSTVFVAGDKAVEWTFAMERAGSHGDGDHRDAVELAAQAVAGRSRLPTPTRRWLESDDGIRRLRPRCSLVVIPTMDRSRLAGQNDLEGSGPARRPDRGDRRSRRAGPGRPVIRQGSRAISRVRLIETDSHGGIGGDPERRHASRYGWMGGILQTTTISGRRRNFAIRLKRPRQPAPGSRTRPSSTSTIGIE